ncbi:MAG TPA: diacylglycerol kinase family protein, partial [Actinomycetes bacterium]|nr:diacylglycerol kinase family protein [Actinomycetes bacterium]
MKALLVHNPTAGGGRAGRLVAEVAERLRADGVETERHQTRSLEDARLAACQAAASFDAVVAVGGDGTVGACAAGLADAVPLGGSGVRAALGVVPAGGGNDAARSLGLPAGD